MDGADEKGHEDGSGDTLFIGDGRQSAEHGDGDGVGRTVDELFGGVEEGADGRHDDGGVETIFDGHAEDAGIGHGLGDGDGGDGHSGDGIATEECGVVVAERLERGDPAEDGVSGSTLTSVHSAISFSGREFEGIFGEVRESIHRG